jgi:hypothetical protein
MKRARLMPSSSVSHVWSTSMPPGPPDQPTNIDTMTKGASIGTFNSSTILQYILPKHPLDSLCHFSRILRLVLILINSVIDVLNRSYDHIKIGSAEFHILEAILRRSSE